LLHRNLFEELYYKSERKMHQERSIKGEN